METVPVLCLDDFHEDRALTSRNHAFVAQNISFYLQLHYREKYRVCPHLSLSLNGWETIPDISVFRQGVLTEDWRNDEDEVLLPPDLVVEVLSPQQNLQPLVRKIVRYLESGVKSCWLVQPMTHLVVLYNPSQPEASFSNGVMHDPPTGIDMSIDELFA